MPGSVCQIFASDRGSLQFNAVARVIPCEYRHKWKSDPLKTRFFGLRFTPRMYRCILQPLLRNRPKSYQSLRNNAKYTAIMPFKVIQGHPFGTSRMPILVNNTDLPSLHRFQVMADYWSNFPSDRGVPHGGVPLRISRKTLPLEKLEWLSYSQPDAHHFFHSFIFV